jgi:Asparagine synthase
VTVPLYLLCQAASQEVSVIFNGEGGDRLFAGWTNKPLIAASIYGGNADFTHQYLQTFHRLYGYESRSFQPQILTQIQSLHPADWIGEILWLIMMWERWRIQVFGAQPTGKSWNHPFWLPQPLWRSIQRANSSES